MQQNKVRIIGGMWRSRQLRFPDAGGLRPSADRVRETLFNWLGQDLTGLAVLDLFAGSGALGFEALSRGAAGVVMVEANPGVHAALKANAAQLKAEGVELLRMDALQFLRHNGRQFDVIFLDPPFNKGYLPKLWPLLPAHLSAQGTVYVESEAPLTLPAGWQLEKSGRCGAAYFHLLRPVQDAAA
jgi:16S rRNA (guanine966-N2)-methyltransferase